MSMNGGGDVLTDEQNFHKFSFRTLVHYLFFISHSNSIVTYINFVSSFINYFENYGELVKSYPKLIIYNCIIFHTVCSVCVEQFFFQTLGLVYPKTSMVNGVHVPKGF